MEARVWMRACRTAGIFLVVVSGCKHPANEDGGEPCRLAVGEVVINEVMPTPAGGAEWIEFYNTTDRALPLNRAVVAIEGDGEPRQLMLTGAGVVLPHGYFVVGDAPDSFVDYVTEGSLRLNGDQGGVALSCRNDTIDSVHYGESEFKPAQGRSLGYDGGANADAELNDDTDYWCLAKSRYDANNSGTPGSANPVCGIVTCLDGDQPRAVVSPARGEILISEALIKPLNGSPWIEVASKASTRFDLNGLSINNQNSDGNARSWRIAVPQCLTVNPGELRVIAFGSDPSREIAIAGETPYRDNGSITLIHQGVTMDSIELSAPKEGVSVSRDPLTDAVCDAPDGGASALPGHKATPGQANDPCGLVCRGEDGRLRRVHQARAGDLVVSEVMANPAEGDDGREWLEVYVSAQTAVDLNSLRITNTSDSGSSKSAMVEQENCLAAAPGTYRVLGGTDVATVGIEGAVVVTGLSLYNTIHSLRLETETEVVDEAVLVPSPENVALSLDPELLDVASNDNPAAFCNAQTAGLFQGLGTPGLPNELCNACIDNGVWRRRRPPSPGDLVLSEVYSDPVGADGGREWLEVYVAAPRSVDLNGLIVTHSNANDNQRQTAIENSACLVAEPGSYLVIGGPTAVEDGVPITTEADINLYNSAGTVSLSMAGMEIDTAVLPEPLQGVALSLDRGLLNAADNDDPAAFCHGRSNDLFDGQGTPGMDNDPCGAFCREGDAWRPLRPARPGDLFFNEVFANPIGADEGRDWLELLVAAAMSVDLNGVTFTHRLSETQSRTFKLDDATRCLVAQPQSYLVIAGPNAEGMTPAATIDGFDLYASSRGVLMMENGEGVVDTAELPRPAEGISTALSPGGDNDTPSDWCHSPPDAPATPGAANNLCP